MTRANTSAGATELSLSLMEAGALEPDDVLRRLATGTDGLRGTEAIARRERVGPNVLGTRRVTALDVLIRQLRNPLLILLLAAATVSVLTGGVTDGAIIGVIVVLSVGLGFLNEYRSEQAVAALHAGVHHGCSVWRDGQEQRMDVVDLVPGDVIRLRLGDLVPADVRLLEVTQLECNEALLSGESMPVSKTVASSQANSPLELTSCAFMGTIVNQGSGRAVVVSTGSRTAFGELAASLGEPQVETSFQLGLRNFSRLLVYVAGSLTTGIFVVNIVLHRPVLQALLFSLAIAIGITPQLLPAVVSVSLSSGSRRLAKRRVLVKRLVTIEDLGNIEVLFTDKTGTLTEGAITFAAALDTGGAPSDAVRAYGLACNEATIGADGQPIGNALDVALLSAAGQDTTIDGQGGAARASSPGPSLPSFRRLGFAPFDHERQLASVVVSVEAAGGTQEADAMLDRSASEQPTLLIAKGAPEAVLARCVDVEPAANDTLQRLFAEGARVVAVATRKAPGLEVPKPSDEHDLHLVGFLSFVDRPKPQARESIAALQRMGIDVKILTGDNGLVAEKVCKDLGMAVSGVMSGTDLAALDDTQLADIIQRTTIFARVSPADKARVVTIARKAGADVAFLGDGVNDAVALHAADVGISVDSAVDIAKDAADIVLLDKDLGVLADGVLEGRRIFANTLKYVLMATSSNFGNMFSAAGASMFLGFLPMLPSQILLNNLLYDAGQLAIPGDAVDPEVLARPAAWDIGFVRRFMGVFGPISSVFDFTTFFVMLNVLHASHEEFRSGWFVESAVTQAMVVFLIRTRRVPFVSSRPSRTMLITPFACALIGIGLTVSPVAHLLGFVGLPREFYLILLAMTLCYLGLVELAKAGFYRWVADPVTPTTTPHQRRVRRLERRRSRYTSHTMTRADAPTPVTRPAPAAPSSAANDARGSRP